MKRTLSLLLALVMVISMIPAVFAETTDKPELDFDELLPCEHIEKKYTDNKDGATHKVTCSTCDEFTPVDEDHNFVDGTCICGAVETPTCKHVAGNVVVENIVNGTVNKVNPTYDAVVYCTVCGEELSRTPTTAPKSSFGGLSMSLGESLALKVAIYYSHVQDGYTFNIRKVGVDGSVVNTTFTKANLDDYNNSYKTYTYSGLAARHMNDKFYVTMCDAEGNIISAYQDSIHDYILRMFGKATKDIDRSVYVNLLNYGAAAQKEFGYGTEDTYANVDLTDTHKAYATNYAAGENKQNNIQVSVQLKNTLEMTFAVKKTNVTNATRVEVTYNKLDGSVVKKEFEAGSFPQYNNTYWKFVIDVPLAYGTQMITVTGYNGETVVYTGQDSLEGYLSRNYTREICQATWQVVCSAKAYFESKQ